MKLLFFKINSLGSGLGPSFVLYDNTGYVLPLTYTRQQLLNGVNIQVSDNANVIYVKSKGELCKTCDTEAISAYQIPNSLNCITTTSTSTSTTSTTTSACCAPGLVEVNNGTQCLQVLTSPRVSVATRTPTNGPTDIDYGRYGVKIYDVNGYNSSGIATLPLAFYGPRATVDGLSDTPVETFWGGRMNLINLWVAGNSYWPGTNGCEIGAACGYPNYVSFCETIITPQQKTYYVGIAGDNYISMKINGNLILSQPSGPPSIADNFRWWHIYPVVLQANLINVIEIQCWNQEIIGSFAAEIYDNTLTELTSAVDTSTLNRIFSTANYRIGGSSQGQSFCNNFECPPGYNYDVDQNLCIKSTLFNCGQTPP